MLRTLPLLTTPPAQHSVYTDMVLAWLHRHNNHNGSVLAPTVKKSLRGPAVVLWCTAYLLVGVVGVTGNVTVTYRIVKDRLHRLAEGLGPVNG